MLLNRHRELRDAAEKTRAQQQLVAEARAEEAKRQHAAAQQAPAPDPEIEFSVIAGDEPETGVALDLEVGADETVEPEAQPASKPELPAEPKPPAQGKHKRR